MKRTTPGSMPLVLPLLFALAGTLSSTATKLTSTVPDHERQVSTPRAVVGVIDHQGRKLQGDASDSSYVEAAAQTAVSVSATAYDERPGDARGCGEDGCLPALAYDGDGDDDGSRWSCAKKLVPDGGQCEIMFSFETPQDIVGLKVSFWKGDERTRTLKVTMNGEKIGEFESTAGATTTSYDIQRNDVLTVTLESIGLDTTGWISLLEVNLMVAPVGGSDDDSTDDEGIDDDDSDITTTPAPNTPAPNTPAPNTPTPTTPVPFTAAPTPLTPTNSSLEFVSDVRLEFGDDVTILGCSDSWIYVESPSAPTVQADELLLITNVQEGVSYSDTLVDSCECFPLTRRIVGVEATQEHDGISCSGSSCWVLTSELLTPLGTISSTDVEDLALTDFQDIPWESFLGDICAPSETNGRKLLGECRDSWEAGSDGVCPYNSCPADNCYYCSNDSPGGCDNGCGPASFPGAVTEFIADVTPFGNGCCNHDHCWVATGEKDLCDEAFLRDNLEGCRNTFGISAYILQSLYASCNLVGAAFYLLVASRGDTPFAEAVAKQEAWNQVCDCPDPEASLASGECVTDEPKRGGSSDGDPHLRTYDGTRFDCHGQGEFVLTKAAATETEVQARFQQWSQNLNPAVTVTTGIAAREGTSSLVQVTTAASGGVEILVDGEPYDESADSSAVTGVTLQVTSSRVEMAFVSGVDVFVSASINGMLRVNVYAPVSLATTGLLGNNNGELGDDFATADGEAVGFATTYPTRAEGTNYCTTNWCTIEGSSIFTYAEGEGHSTFDLCDAVYSAPVLPDAIPAAITELCGDNAECILDALLAGEEVGQATLDAQAEDQLYQEEVAGLCVSNFYSSTGAPPCTACPDGEVSGTGATSCIRQELVGLSVPANIAAAMAADATGGFAGPGSLTTTPVGTIELTEEDGGSVAVSGTFVRDDGAALPSSTTVFLYTENTAQPDDFIRGQEALDLSTGEFSTVVTDIPAGSSRLFLSFVVVDPAEALDPAGADTAFALDVTNSACTPSLTITLEWSAEFSDVDLYVQEPGGRLVYYSNRVGDVGFLDNDDTSGFGPENYIIDSGLDPGTSQVLGEYQVYVELYRGDAATETWRLTARVSGEVAWTEEGDFTSSTTSETFTVPLTDYDASCGGIA